MVARLPFATPCVARRRLASSAVVFYTANLKSAFMGTRMLAVLVTICFSVIGVLGDYFLKLASAREHSLRTGWFYLGFALYASTAFGWVFVMKHLKLASIGVLYAVSLVLLLTAVGVVLFRESLNYLEMTGIVFAVISLVLLMRFA
jgi:drug/metabolite transporter (DMT)-like permease